MSVSSVDGVTLTGHALGLGTTDMVDESIDSYYARWQRNPDAAHTAALCEALRGGARPDLVESVGKHAARQLDIRVLLAAARMYADTGRLDDAQTVLLAAGRLAPREADVYLWLGEVLLRRGDPERAQRVLERAVQFGSAAAVPLLERARGRGPTHRASRPPPGVEQRARAGARHAPPRAVPAASEEDDDFETHIRPQDDVRVAIEAALAPLASPAPPPPLRAGSAPPPAPFASSAPPSPPAPRAPVEVEVAARAPADERRLPDPREVLDALAIVGVYEPTALDGQAEAWARPDRGKRRVVSVAALAGLTLLLVGGGFGTYGYVQSVRAKERLEAEALVSEVEANLRAGDAALLAASEDALSKAFELDSRSREASLAWVRERALKGLLEGGEDIGFEDATQRAKAVGVDESSVAFAYVASFLFHGDTAGAASAIAKWDSAAAEDPWFQLLAGATLERAGDPRSVERYEKALELDPSLVVAEVRLARATAIDGDPGAAAERAAAFRARHPDRVEGAALVALAWARAPLRGEPPAEVAEVIEHGARLPASLRAISHAARAMTALGAGSSEEAKPALRDALALADTPGIATWLGEIALGTADEALARRAALSAVSFSAIYPPARVLAARVALLGGRLDEALKAVEELTQSSVEVAVVSAAVAYERLDDEGMTRALEAVPDDAREHPTGASLRRGRALLVGDLEPIGRGGAEMAKHDAPWSDLVALDWALDTGALELARTMVDTWVGAPSSMRAVRLARLARYTGRLEEADERSRAALEGGGSATVRALAERVFTLVALKRTADALDLFKAHPNVGGPLSTWLRAYALAAHGKVQEARAIVSQEDPPPALAPMPARTIAAAALALVDDKGRGTDYARALVQAGFTNPDVDQAADRLGAGRPAQRRR